MRLPHLRGRLAALFGSKRATPSKPPVEPPEGPGAESSAVAVDPAANRIQLIFADGTVESVTSDDDVVIRMRHLADGLLGSSRTTPR